MRTGRLGVLESFGLDQTGENLSKSPVPVVKLFGLGWYTIDGKLHRGIPKVVSADGAEIKPVHLNQKDQLLQPQKYLRVDRSKPFDPTELFGQGWRIVDDKFYPSMTEINPADIEIRSVVRGHGHCLNGEKRQALLSLDASMTTLDIVVMVSLFQNQEQIPEYWKKEVDGVEADICFDGTLLIGPDNLQYIPYLYWCKRDELWNIGRTWFDGPFHSDKLSALLPVPKWIR